MQPRKRTADVVDLTADHELASNSPKRPKVERHHVMDLSPIMVDLASAAEAATAPANPCLPQKSVPPSPEVIDSDDDAPSGRMASADGQCAALGGVTSAQVCIESYSNPQSSLPLQDQVANTLLI